MRKASILTLRPISAATFDSALVWLASLQCLSDVQGGPRRPTMSLIMDGKFTCSPCTPVCGRLRTLAVFLSVFKLSWASLSPPCIYTGRNKIFDIAFHVQIPFSTLCNTLSKVLNRPQSLRRGMGSHNHRPDHHWVGVYFLKIAGCEGSLSTDVV